MPDAVSISGAIGAIKSAVEIAKILRSIDASMQSAELKIKIADLTDALATAKLALIDVQGLIAEKDAEIDRLKSALKSKAEVVRHGSAYFETTPEGKPVGDPYCSHCFEVKHELVHIHQHPMDINLSICPSCQNKFPWQRRQNPAG